MNIIKIFKLKNIVLFLIFTLICVNIVASIRSKEYVSRAIEASIKKTKINVDCKRYEKAVEIARSSFKKIPHIDYSSNYSSIWNLAKTIINTPKGRIYALDMLTEIEGHENLSKEARLYVNKKLKLLYIMNGNYAKASEYVIKTIKYSKSIDDVYDEVKSRIELGVIYRRLGGYEVATRVIEDAMKIKIQDKKDDANMKVYAYLNLAQINIELENYDKAKEMCDLVPKYKIYFSDEDYRDIEISKEIIEAKVYLYNNNLNMAKENLSHIKFLMKNDKDEYIIDKDLEELVVQANYEFKAKNYDKSKTIYNEALSLSKLRNQDIYVKPILSDLLKLATENKDEYLKEKYYNEILEFNKKQEKIRYQAYVYYINTNVEKEISIMHDLKYNKMFYMIAFIIMLFMAIALDVIYKRIKYRLTHDALTNTYNRYSLDKKYKYLLRKNKEFAAIMIDIDDFKSINDTYGHEFGDIVLINMCNVVKAILNKDSNIYRYGGEEFAILSKNSTKVDVLLMAEKIRYYVEAMIWENDIKITVSAGIAFSDIEKELTIQKADKNLYKAKHTGKNKVVM